MSGNVNEIYTVQGSMFQSTESLRAIARAKEEAIKNRQPKLVYLNGNPVYKVDRKGKLAAA